MLPHLTSVCADDAEVLALSVLRFVAAGYMTSDVACWDAAYDGVEQVLGPLEGPKFIAAMAGIMRAIRCERQDDWRFMPATCCRVTEDEHQLITLIALARQRRRPEEVEAQAARLVKAFEAPRLTASVWAAAEVLGAVKSQLIPEVTASSRAGLH
ncbi:hypothetical protein [Microvirga massiliensis]|uniref:hypothetical protein n=1 Tax=Microvirga massiliensis TaxID=1033741 RepID=UPI0011C79011|nr:hypothetical protein [Microvirga massiliensis]